MSVDEIFQKLLTGRPRGPVLPMTAEELFRMIKEKPDNTLYVLWLPHKEEEEDEGE
jgi:hypothetical protein